MLLTLDPSNIDDYRTFLAIKALPRYEFTGRQAWFPDEYATQLGMAASPLVGGLSYEPQSWLFDYQRDISRLAIRKQKFAGFIDCGFGKTFILTEWIRHASEAIGREKCALIVSPLMVVDQTLEQVRKFYGADLPIEHVKAKDLSRWIETARGVIGITNYEALKDSTPQGRLGALALDESSMLKSAYGKWGQVCIRLGKGLAWKLCLTGTPAPNDRIEFGNHAVFLDAFPTLNSFLAKFFVNRGQTDNRWELKPHALKPFYRALSDWSIFMTNPATYGWKDNTETIPPIHTHIHEVDLTNEQRQVMMEKTGMMLAPRMGGITNRSVMSQLAKGKVDGESIATNKNEFIRELVGSWSAEESSIVWCHYDAEQEAMEREFPDAASISGPTKLPKRLELLGDFQAQRRRVLISKGKVLGFGLNLQVATRHVFSGLQDSYETYYQCIKRSNRCGSTRPLNVHIPVTELEMPMIETVLAKADRVQADTAEQEAIFKECGHVAF